MYISAHSSLEMVVLLLRFETDLIGSPTIVVSSIRYARHIFSAIITAESLPCRLFWRLLYGFG